MVDTALVRARNPGVVDYRLSDGQALLLNLESGDYHQLNAVGAEIWQLMDGERDLAEICRRLRSRLEDPPSGLEAIVADFFLELSGRNLLA